MSKSIDDPMYVEWRAWQIVVDQFRRLGMEVNDERNDTLIRAIQAWGELLVELRVVQSDAIVTEARVQALLRLLNVGVDIDDIDAKIEIAPR